MAETTLRDFSLYLVMQLGLFQVRRMEETMIRIGDFFATKGSGISGWANEHLTCTPRGSHTDRYHFGVIAHPVLDDKGNFVDFETRESISKGVSPLRFFERYAGQDIELYRIKGITKLEGLRLATSISKIGMTGYGYADFFQAFLDVGRLLITGNFPPYTPEHFIFSRNNKYICTEIPAYGANEIGKSIEPPNQPDLWDIPVIYLQAIEDGKLVRYYKGDLNDIWSTLKGRKLYHGRYIRTGQQGEVDKTIDSGGSGSGD